MGKPNVEVFEIEPGVNAARVPLRLERDASLVEVVTALQDCWVALAERNYSEPYAWLLDPSLLTDLKKMKAQNNHLFFAEELERGYLRGFRFLASKGLPEREKTSTLQGWLIARSPDAQARPGLGYWFGD